MGQIRVPNPCKMSLKPGEVNLGVSEFNNRPQLWQCNSMEV
jgi:20S proteasome alpha/beta subunit